MPKGYIYAELEMTDPALFETSTVSGGQHWGVRWPLCGSWR